MGELIGPHLHLSLVLFFYVSIQIMLVYDPNLNQGTLDSVFPFITRYLKKFFIKIVFLRMSKEVLSLKRILIKCK